LKGPFISQIHNSTHSHLSHFLRKTLSCKTRTVSKFFLKGKGKIMARVMMPVLLCFLFAAWSCAGIQLPAAGADHPANPDARSAAPSRPSHVLDMDEDALPSPPPIQPQSKMHPAGSRDPESTAHEKGEQRK
jgi:hypothetical protein